LPRLPKGATGDELPRDSREKKSLDKNMKIEIMRPGEARRGEARMAWQGMANKQLIA